MPLKQKKISVRQAMIMLLVITYSPTMRLVPQYTAKYAKQAGWLAPVVSFGIVFLLVIVLDRIYKKYHDEDVSLMDIMYDIFGKYAGKIVVAAYILFLTALIAFYARFYSERLVSTIVKDIDIRVFLIVIFVLAAIVMRSELVVVARMCEIIFYVLLFIFTLIIIFAIPNVDLKNITPISYNDILPITRASLATTNIWILITLIYIFSDKFWDKKNIKKMTMATNIFHLCVTPPLIITSIGAFGYALVERLPFPYLVTIKQISLFHTLERLEPYIVALWVASDFIIVLLFSYMLLHMLKSLFNLHEVKQMINIYLLFVYFFSLYIARTKFELDYFTNVVEIPLKILFCFIIPVLILLVGKIRKKV